MEANMKWLSAVKKFMDNK